MSNTVHLTLADLKRAPKKLKALAKDGVLIATTAETLVRSADGGGAQTMVFMHETMEMMRAQRQERIEQLRRILQDDAMVMPLVKKADSFWDHITVGRLESADIELDDPAVSNVHAHFEFDKQEAAMALQDVGSSNGTFVNRDRLQPHAPMIVRSGDCLRFGQSIFYYVAQSTLEKLFE